MGKAFELKLDHAGIQQLLKSGEIAKVCGDLAEEIAASARGQHPDLDIVVDHYETDRAAASVTIRDRRGRAFEIRDGILTKAAAARGLEVKANHD